MEDLPMRHLTSFASEAEARALQAALSTQGIECNLINAEVVSNLWHYSNAVGGVRVEVEEDDWEAAQAVMGASSAPGVEWVCAKCHAENDAGFDICWQCSSEHTQSTEPSTTIDNQETIEPHPLRDLATQEEPLLNRDLEQLQQAWKATKFGFAFFIGFLHVYSLGLLLTINLDNVPEKERWKFFAAWVLDLAVIIVFLVFIKSLFRH